MSAFPFNCVHQEKSILGYFWTTGTVLFEIEIKDTFVTYYNVKK